MSKLLNIYKLVPESYVQTNRLPVFSSPVLLRKALLSHSRRKVAIVTITAFVPDWTANDELSELAAKRKGLESYVGSLHGYDIRFSTAQSCDVIQLNNRVETMPERLRDVPMRSILVVKHNSPVTAAVDGPYEDDDITARVETYVKDGVAQQSIKVMGTNGTTVETLNRWFDDLTAGKKADKNLNPITYPAETTMSA